MKKLWEVIDKELIIKGLQLDEEGEGYPPPADPKILPGRPDGQARFVAKHMHGDGTRITDIDPSTLDDDLFKAANMKRAVPGPNGDTHGHTPVGRDAAVYESLFSRVGLSSGKED